MVNTPVAIFLYKKLASVEIILNKISESAPSKVYIVMDGPEDQKTRERQNEIMEVISIFNFTVPFQIIHPKVHLGIRTIIQFGLQGFRN